MRFRRNQPTLLYFCIFMLFLLSMNLWIGWAGRGKYIQAVFSVGAALSVMGYGVRLNFSWRNLLSLAVIIGSHFYIYEVGGTVILSFCLPVSIILLLRDKERILCLNWILKWYALLLVPSIILYAVTHVASVPSFGMLTQGNTVLGYHPYHNYILYALPTSQNYYFRFNGPFLEPGHLGMMSAFLLTATGFDLKKKYTWIVLVAIVMSLSLAGWVLAFVGYVLVRFYQGKIELRWAVLFVSLVIGIYLAGTLYDGGNNILNEKIFSRLEADEDRGFSGNNRVFGQIQTYYEAMWMSARPKLLLYGYDKNTIQWLAAHGSRGTGFVMYTVSHGLVGVISASLFYVIFFLLTRYRKIALLMLIFVAMCFWQRSYPFWHSWVVCYVYGITYLGFLNENRDSYLPSES